MSNRNDEIYNNVYMKKPSTLNLPRFNPEIPIASASLAKGYFTEGENNSVQELKIHCAKSGCSGYVYIDKTSTYPFCSYNCAKDEVSPRCGH